MLYSLHYLHIIFHQTMGVIQVNVYLLTRFIGRHLRLADWECPAWVRA